MSYRLLASSLLAFAGLGIVAGPAAAADLDPGYGLIPPQQEERVEFGTGWYVRGDLGVTNGLAVSSNDLPYIDNRSGPGTATPTVSAASSHRVTYTGTLGGGYQFNKWFRADATFDFHQATSSSIQGASHNCITATYLNADLVTESDQNATCTPTLKASLKSYSALINGYVDLGTWYRVTPYIGAGVGMSFGHATSSATYIQNNNVGYAGISYIDKLSGTTFTQNWDRQSSTQYYNVAFALMGGIAIDVFDHTKLDIGYRYLHLGQVLGANLATQEVRAGLRYMIDN